MATPDLLDLLSGILDDDDTDPPAPAVPVAEVAEPPPPLPTEIQPDPPAGEVVPIETARKRKPAADTRAGLVDEAVDAAHAALAVVRQSFESGGADFDDAVKALPVVHKIIEHAERIEVARKAPDQWRVANFVIDLSDNAVQEPPRLAIKVRPQEAPTAVIDLDSAE